MMVVDEYWLFLYLKVKNDKEGVIFWMAMPLVYLSAMMRAIECTNFHRNRIRNQWVWLFWSFISAVIVDRCCWRVVAVIKMIQDVFICICAVLAWFWWGLLVIWRSWYVFIWFWLFFTVKIQVKCDKLLVIDASDSECV